MKSSTINRWLWLFWIIGGGVVFGTPLSLEEANQIKSKLETLESAIERLDAEMEIVKAQSRMVIERTNVAFLDRFYVRIGMSMVLPRARTFKFGTDTGLGAFVGIGHYFGRHHVGDLGIEWDIYPAISLQYRYEFHSESPTMTWGPVIGVKVKAAEGRPWDDFLDRPDLLKTTFPFFGLILGFPIGRSLFAIQMLYLVNQQAFLFSNIGVHFFL